jgi:hypothetical protein
MKNLQKSAIAIIFTVIAISGCDKFSKQLPTCDHDATIKLTGQIINDLPIAKAAGATFVSLKNIKEQGFNKNSEIRACEATLVTTKGEDNLQYSIKWQDKSSGNIWIEAEIETASSSDISVITNQVANDFEKQYFLAKRNGASAVDICVQAGLVSAGYLQAQDENNYSKWKLIEKQECLAAGVNK